MNTHHHSLWIKTLSLGLCVLLLTGCAAQGTKEEASSPAVEKTAEEAKEAEPEKTEEKDAAAEPEETPDKEPAVRENEAVTGPPEVLIMKKDQEEYDEKYDILLYSGHLEGVVLSDESREAWPALYDTLQKDWKEDLEQYKESVLSLTEDSAEQYRAMREDDPETEYSIHYEDSVTADVTRVDEKVFSWSSSFYMYYGGAHGMYGNSGRSYDAATGKRLQLSDVITDGKAFGQLLFDKVSVEYPDVVDYLEDPDALRDEIVKEVLEDPENWALEPVGIDYFFNPYDIAAYAAGEQIIHIDYAEAPELFAKDYLPESQEAVIYGVPNGRDVYLDADGDGKTDHIMVDIDYDDWDEDQEEYLTQGITAYVHEGMENMLATFSNVDQIRARVVSFASGEQYLLISCLADYEDDVVLICSVSEGYVNELTEYGLSQKRLFDPDTELYGCYELTDPGRMLLSERFDRLATFFGEGVYGVNDRGEIAPVEDYAVISEDAREYLQLTSSSELTAQIVDEDGSVVAKEEVLPAGTVYALYRTAYGDEQDGVFVDCLLQDGRIARLSYTVSEDYDRTVCGVDEQKAFKEVLYAD